MRLGPLGCGVVAAGLALVIAWTARAGARGGVSITPRHETTFALRGTGADLRPGRQRASRAGTTQPGPGDITIGISTTHAMGLPKLHVYERSSKAIAFEAVAMHGAKRLATQHLCGHVDTDTWIVLPARTTRVIASYFVEVDGPCP